MEIIEKNSLQTIFRFSTLANILPFYDYLHRWMLLLKRCCKKTSKLWEEYEDMFICCGKPYRANKHIYRRYCPNSDKLILHKYMYFKYFHILKDYYFSSFIQQFLSQIKSDFVVLLDINDGSNVDTYNYKMAYLKKADLSDYIPGENCSEYIPTTFSFEELDQFGYYLDNLSQKLKSKAIIIEIREVLSQTYQIEDLIGSNSIQEIRSYKYCKNNNCCCSPKILQFLKSTNLIRLHNRLNRYCNLICYQIFDCFELAKAVESIREIRILPEFEVENYDVEELNTLFRLMKETRNIKIYFPRFLISGDSNPSEMLEFNTRQMCIIINSVITPLIFNFSCITINGKIKDIVNIRGSECVVVRVELLDCSHINVHYDLDNYIFQSKEYDFLRNMTKNDTGIYVVIRTQNLKTIEFMRIGTTNPIFQSSSFQNKNILLKRYSTSNIINDLKCIPKNNNLQLCDDYEFNHSIYDIDSEFWSIVNEFKSVDLCFGSLNFKLISVINQSEGSNKSVKSLRIFHDKHDKVISYEQFLEMIKKIVYFKYNFL